MLFNSIEYLFFLPIIFILFWFVFNKFVTAQNILLLVGSYIFYGWWDWRFLGLIVLSSFVDYFLARLMTNAEGRQRMLLLWVSILVNLGVLAFFKYFNFFSKNAEVALNSIGLNPDFITLNILLPVGISFYTFQTLSYSIDVYRREIEPEKDIFKFFAYVAFFPQLVAGPIERAKNFLPQFSRAKQFQYENGVDGCRQILWGLFKKVVIADSCAPYVDTIFSNPSDYNGPTLMLGAVLFAFQIYGDFSGYTDIAIGTARLFGFNLMRNFAYPYFSRDIAEFWRRWHISLSSWFKDYLYFPLGGSRGSKTRTIFNVFVIFLVSGFWHGANWTFIIWGALNALYMMPSLIRNRNRLHTEIVAENSFWMSGKELLQITVTFFLICLAWIFFRAESVSHAVEFVSIMINPARWGTANSAVYDGSLPILGGFVGLMIIIEWLNRRADHGLANMKFNSLIRYLIYLLLILSILYFWRGGQDFIYFQF